jgi:addiction module HigA family antidote
MIRVPTKRQPTHPGEMLAEEFLLPMGISQRKLAKGIHVSYGRVNEIVNQRRGISPSMALRLAKFFRTSGAFWMSLQQRWDLYQVQKAEASDLKKIRPHATLAA